MPDGVRPPGIFPKCAECQVNTRRFGDGDARASRAGIRHGCNLIGSKSVPWRIPEECWTAIRRDPRGTGSRPATAASDTGASPVRATLGPEGRHGTLMRARPRARRVSGHGWPGGSAGQRPPEGWIRVGRAGPRHRARDGQVRVEPRPFGILPGRARSRGARQALGSCQDGRVRVEHARTSASCSMAGPREHAPSTSCPGWAGRVEHARTSASCQGGRARVEHAKPSVSCPDGGARGARRALGIVPGMAGLAWSTPGPRHRVRMAGFAWSTPRPLGIVPEMAGARGARPALGIVPGMAGFAWSTPVDIVPGRSGSRGTRPALGIVPEASWQAAPPYRRSSRAGRLRSEGRRPTREAHARFRAECARRGGARQMQGGPWQFGRSRTTLAEDTPVDPLEERWSASKVPGINSARLERAGAPAASDVVSRH